jgi:hypothetical protein
VWMGERKAICANKSGPAKHAGGAAPSWKAERERGMSGEELERGAVTIKHAAFGWVQQRLSIVGTDRRSACGSNRDACWDAGCLGWDASTRSRPGGERIGGRILGIRKRLRQRRRVFVCTQATISDLIGDAIKRAWPGKRASLQPGMYGGFLFSVAQMQSCRAAGTRRVQF